MGEKVAVEGEFCPRNWPAPLRLLASLLASRSRTDARQTQATALAETLTLDEWRAFGTLVVDRHRVAPLMAANLPNPYIPENVSARIQDAARQAAVEGIWQKAETLRLAPLFAAKGIEPVLLKGWSLAERLYGSAAMRQGRDIDLLLLDSSDFSDARQVLEDAGYSLAAQSRERLSEKSKLPYTKDVEFERAGLPFTIELHARSNAYPEWPNFIDLQDGVERRTVDETGMHVRVPTKRGDLIYLSIHGMQHVYSRLRWLHDVMTLVEQSSDEELARALAEADRINAARFVRISVALAGEVFGLRWPAPWRRQTASERVVVRLILAALPASSFDRDAIGASFHRMLLKLIACETGRQRMGLLRGGRSASLWLA